MTKIVQRNIPPQAAQTLQASGTSSLMARLLAARGISDANQLSIHLSNLLPPNTLTNNVAMAKLLADAIRANKKLLVIDLKLLAQRSIF